MSKNMTETVCPLCGQAKQENDSCPAGCVPFTPFPLDKDGEKSIGDGKETVRWVCQDGGLWQVWRSPAGDKDESKSRTIGFVWNHGYMPEERAGQPYRALDGWVDGVQPGNEIGQAPTLE